VIAVSGERLVQAVELTALVHATEDESKVRKAVLSLLPPGLDPPAFEAVRLKGYYGDPITVLKLYARHRRQATKLLENIINRLSSLDIQTLLDALPQHIDESKNLYMRLDKQKAYVGKTVLERHDSIRVKARLLLPHKADPVESIRMYLESLERSPA
jgi:RNA binding exosome subunit